MVAITEKLGRGIYTPAEAAFYARLPRGVMTRWVFGDTKGRPVIERELQDPTEKVVTFLDFVQTIAVREVLNRTGLSLQKIRRALDEARRLYNIERPLACPHTIYLFSDQRGEGHGDIIIRLSGECRKDEDQFVQLTGKKKGNLMMRPIVELFLEDLQFDPKTGLANLFTPMKCDGASIVLDPHRRFGEPIVDPGGYTAETLWHATNTEGGIEEAAEAYGVSVSEVILANKYFDMLLPGRTA